MPRQNLQENFAQLTEFFASDGLEIDDQTRQFLQPLLSGQMTLKEHETWLLEQLAEARA